MLPTITTHSYFWLPSKDEKSLWPETKSALGCSGCEDLCLDPTRHPSSSKTTFEAKVERASIPEREMVLLSVSLTTGHGWVK